MKLGDVCRTWGDVRQLLDVLEAKGDVKALRVRRDIAQQTLRCFEESGRRPPAWLPAMVETPPALRQLESAEADRRRLEQRLAAAKSDVRRLRGERFGPVVDAAVRRGVLDRSQRESTLARLLEGDEQLEQAIDPNYRPSEAVLERYRQEFAHSMGVPVEEVL